MNRLMCSPQAEDRTLPHIVKKIRVVHVSFGPENLECTMDARKIRAWIRAEVHRIYGDQVVRMILTGSRARGEHGPQSDWDVVVVLRDYDFSDAIIVKKLIAPDGNNVEIVPVNQEGLDHHPGRYMEKCRKWGRDL
jgi:predicted nucleotidyltransferase